MKKLDKIISTLIALALLLTTFPDVIATASPSVNHEADDALLLMLASHNMLMDGGLASGHPRAAAVNLQTNENEVKILTDIYRQQIAEVNQQGYGDHIKARLLLELDTKLQILEAKARRLDAERQNRRRGGLFGRFFRAPHGNDFAHTGDLELPEATAILVCQRPAYLSLVQHGSFIA